MKEALFWETGDAEGKVNCHLCAHHCVISPGKRGICSVRENRDGKLYSLVYGMVVAHHIDPIEKKPLYHFHPGSRSYSIATVGCNFRCKHCQNFDISEYPRRKEGIPGDPTTPMQVVEAAKSGGCKSISYTYTEPTIFMEFALDCSRLAREQGLSNVFVSNGFTTAEATRAIAPYLDANNIDLKGDDDFYRKICGARLQPVIETIRLMKELGVWVEVTTLIIPGYNDSEDYLRWAAGFIASVDRAMPWHVTQFHPTYQLLDRPRTPLATLQHAYEIGKAEGLHHVYVGNAPGGRGEHTFCHACGETLIERVGFHVTDVRTSKGLCPKCDTPLAGIGI